MCPILISEIRLPSLKMLLSSIYLQCVHRESCLDFSLIQQDSYPLMFLLYVLMFHGVGEDE